MSEVEVMPFADLIHLPTEATEVWVTPPVRARVAEALPFEVGEPPEPAPGVERLIAVGGGTLIDQAKAWRADRSPGTQLIAVPSLWGSGAEISPVVVLNEDGRKAIRMDDRFLPDQVVYWPELAYDLPEELVLTACGDSWCHAVEGFLSPLAQDSLRGEIAELMRRMRDRGIGNHADWFELSGRACAAQARSSVGLVHGIAHTLEGHLRAVQPAGGWGHAKLCSVFLWPVVVFDTREDGKARRLLEQYGVNVDDILQVAHELHDPVAYKAALPILVEHWRSVLRDPSTRTNVRLVRPGDLAFFDEWRAE